MSLKSWIEKNEEENYEEGHREEDEVEQIEGDEGGHKRRKKVYCPKEQNHGPKINI